MVEAKALTLFSAIDHAFRFDALLLLARYLREPPPADDKISDILRHERLSVGAWLELFESLLNVTGRGRVQELLRPWFRRHQAAGRFDRLITFRNEYAHGRGSVEDLTTLLQAEQTWRSTRTAATQARTQALRRSVQAFKAVGGGWDAPTTAPRLKPKDFKQASVTPATQQP